MTMDSRTRFPTVPTERVDDEDALEGSPVGPPAAPTTVKARAVRKRRGTGTGGNRFSRMFSEENIARLLEGNRTFATGMAQGSVALAGKAVDVSRAFWLWQVSGANGTFKTPEFPEGSVTPEGIVRWVHDPDNIIGFIPIAGTIHHWDQMGPKMRAASVAMDVLSVVAPFVPIRAAVAPIVSKTTAVVRRVKGTTKAAEATSAVLAGTMGSLQTIRTVVKDVGGAALAKRFDSAVIAQDKFANAVIRTRGAEDALGAVKSKQAALQRQLRADMIKGTHVADARVHSTEVKAANRTADGAQLAVDSARRAELAAEQGVRDTRVAFESAADDLGFSLGDPSETPLTAIRGAEAANDTLAQTRSIITGVWDNAPQVSKQRGIVDKLARDARAAKDGLDQTLAELARIEGALPTPAPQGEPSVAARLADRALGEPSVAARLADRALAVARARGLGDVTFTLLVNTKKAARRATDRVSEDVVNLARAVDELQALGRAEVPKLENRLKQIDAAIASRVKQDLPSDQIQLLTREKSEIQGRIVGFTLGDAEAAQKALVATRELVETFPEGGRGWSPTMHKAGRQLKTLERNFKRQQDTLRVVWERPISGGGGIDTPIKVDAPSGTGTRVGGPQATPATRTGNAGLTAAAVGTRVGGPQATPATRTGNAGLTAAAVAAGTGAATRLAGADATEAEPRTTASLSPSITTPDDAPGTDVQPARGTDVQPARDPSTRTTSAPRTDVQPARDPSTRTTSAPGTDVQPARDPSTRTTSAPGTDVQPARDPSTRTTSAPGTDVQPARGTDVQPARDPSTRTTSAPRTDVQPARDPSTRTTPARDPSTRTTPARDPSTRTTPRPSRPITTPEDEPKTPTKTEPKTPTKPDIISDRFPGPMPEFTRFTMPEEEIVTETEEEIVTETEPEIVTETEPEIVTETEPEIVTETEPEIVTETEPEIVTKTPIDGAGRTNRATRTRRSVARRPVNPEQVDKKRKKADLTTPDADGNFPELVAWQSGYGYTVHNLRTGENRFVEDRPAGVPQTSGDGAARRSFTILQRGPKPPTQLELDKGVMRVFVGPGGPRHRRKRGRGRA